jgi:hypothetical protein
MIVGPLPLAEIDKVWPGIAKWMDEACKRGRGSMTAWEIYQGCRCGSMLLFVVWLDDQIKAAIPCRVQTVPEGTSLYVVAIGGTEMKRWLPELYALEWPKSVGVKFVDFEGRAGLRCIHGAKVVRQVFRKEL